MNSKDIRGCVL